MTIKPFVNKKLSNEEGHSSGHTDTAHHGQSTGGLVGSSVRSAHRDVLNQLAATEVTVNKSPQREPLGHSAAHLFDENHVRLHRRSPHNKRIKREKFDKISKNPIYQCMLGAKPAANSHAVSAKPTSKVQTSQTTTTSKAKPAGSFDILDENLSGYNSGDEHIGGRDAVLTPEEWKTRDEQFIKTMSDSGFVLKDVEEDGACLFRAISLQIYGDQDMHEDIRQKTMDYIYQNREYYAQFVTEDINSYVSRKRRTNAHGNHIEIQAMSEMFNRAVELYSYQTKPINIFNHEQLDNGYEPLRLSYQRCSHYNAILNPYKASVGVGLGLAGYSPDRDRKGMLDAEIEKTMFEDKLKTTDWEATNDEMEEQVARESYLQWCREHLRPTEKGSSASSSTITSTEVSNNASSNNNNNNSNNNNNNQNNNPNNSGTSTATATTTATTTTAASATASAAVTQQSSEGEMCVELGFGSQQSPNSASYMGGHSGNSSGGCSSSMMSVDSGGDLSTDDSCSPRRTTMADSRRQSRPRRSKRSPETGAADRSVDTEIEMISSAKRSKGNTPQRETSPPPKETSQSCSPSDNTCAGPSGGSCSNRNEKPISDFYKSLLDSCYPESVTMTDAGTPTEQEMIKQALHMSRMEFITHTHQQTGFMAGFDDYDSASP